MTIEIHRTEKPSTIICFDKDNDQFFFAYTRTGGVFRFTSVLQSAIDDVNRLNKEIERKDYQFGSKHHIRLRSIFFDDKNGAFTMKVDYLHDNQVEPAFTEEDVKKELGDFEVRHHGQMHNTEVRILKVLTSSDYFNPVSDEYYEGWCD